MPITLAYILAEIRTNDESNTLDKIDVAVIRGGIAGIAASIHLARAGMLVVCIEAGMVSGNPMMGKRISAGTTGGHTFTLHRFVLD